MQEAKMQPQISLQILSKKLIRPATPTPPNLRRLKISSLDQCPATIYVSYIICYSPATQQENGQRSKQLQESLSEILTLFYPLAGRYIKDDFSIDCNDHGVEYSEAKVAAHLAPFLSNGHADSKLVMHLIPYQTESSSSPLVAVQCNMFECGRLVIGFCISHRIADAIVVSRFLNGWAKACQSGVLDVDRPNFDLALLLPPRLDVVPETRNVPPLKPGLKIASKTFVFNHLALSNLRRIANRHQRKPSRVRLVTAIIWKALVRIAEAKHGYLRPSVICHMLNLRGNTLLPISDDCCGNLVRPVIVKFTPNSDKNLELFDDLLSLVGDAMTKAVNDCAELQKVDDLFSMVNNSWREANEQFNRKEVDAYSFTSICRMPLHLDFGWGKAVRVSHVQCTVEMILLMDTRDGDGIKARIYLDENDMHLFQQDPDVTTFSSQEEQIDHSTFLRSRC